MNCFLLPKYFYDELNKMVAKFWWNDVDDSRKIHWISWDRLCAPKSEGVLGFKNLYAFNFSLLAKQGWRLIHDQSSSVACVLKAKYIPNSSILDASMGVNESFCWRSLCSVYPIIELDSWWQIEISSNDDIWNDH